MKSEPQFVKKKDGAGRNFASCACPVSRALCITSLAPIIGPHHLGEGVKQLGGVFLLSLGRVGQESLRSEKMYLAPFLRDEK